MNPNAMPDESQSASVPRAAQSVNSQIDGVGPDQADLLDRVLDKGVRVDPVDQICVITGSVDKLDPFVVEERATDASDAASDDSGPDFESTGEKVA